jgi:hypothetical protein
MSDGTNPPFPPQPPASPPPPPGGTGFPSPQVPSGFPQPGVPQPGYPQPGYPQPGYPQQPSAAQPGYAQAGMPGQPAWNNTDAVKKKKKKWPWILLTIFLLLVVGIGGCTAFLVGKVTEVTDVGNNFVSALYTGSAEATAKGCPGAFVAADLENVRSTLIAAGWTGGKNLKAPSIENNNGVSTGAVSGTLATTPISTVNLTLAQNSGKWCVNGISVP